MSRPVIATITEPSGQPREGLLGLPGNTGISGIIEGKHKNASAVLKTPRGVAERRRRSLDMHTVRVPLSRGKYALIDAEDAGRVLAFKWYALTTSGSKTYACRNIRLPDGKKTTQYLHRFLMNAPKGMEVDHKNGDGLDCRRQNMRLATRQQNSANVPMRRCNTSGYVGVSWDKDKSRWRAQIGVNGKTICLGRFKTAEEAARVRAAFARKLHGEFASRDEVSA